MARFFTEEAEQKEEQKKKDDREAQSFRDLLARLYGCSPDACCFQLTNPACDCSSWLEKFEKIEGADDHLICNLELPGHAARGIEIKHKQVRGDLSATRPLQDRFYTAFAMAALARANPRMAEKGVKIQGDTVEEKALLYIASYFMGLKVNNLDKAVQQEAQRIMQGAKVEQLWQTFVKDVNGFTPGAHQHQHAQENHTGHGHDKPQAAAPEGGQSPAAPGLKDKAKALWDRLRPQHPAAPVQNIAEPQPAPAAEEAAPATPPEPAAEQPPAAPPEAAPPPVTVAPEPVPTAEAEVSAESPLRLSEAFNREIPADIKTYLEVGKIDEATYKALSEAVVQDQDATWNHLKEKYKDRFNLTSNQIKHVLNAMDKEGITSAPTKPGQARSVNFDAGGQPKNAPPSVR